MVQTAIQNVDYATGDTSATFDGTLTVNNVAAEPAAGNVKVFFWNMSNVSPIIGCVTK